MSDATEAVDQAAAANEKAVQTETHEGEPPAQAATAARLDEASPVAAPADAAGTTEATSSDTKPAPAAEPEVAKFEAAPADSSIAKPVETDAASSDEPSTKPETPPADAAASPDAADAAPAVTADAPAAVDEAAPAPADVAADAPAPSADAATDAPTAADAPAEGAPAEAATTTEPEPPAPEPEPPAAPPTISGIEPAAVGVKGGAVLTILGGDFAEGCSMLIDGVPVPGARVHASRLEAIVSKHEAGVVDVAVKNPDGQTATLAGALRYVEPPFVEALSPATGLTTGGYEVIIRGRHFEAGGAVLFDGEPLPDLTFAGDGELRVRAPAHHAGAVDVTVVNPSGLSHRVPLAFAFEVAPPRVASITPAFGPNAGGTKVMIRGTDFDDGCQVYICGIAATVTWKSREELWCVTPEVARDGLVDVRVVNLDAQASTLEKAYRYDAPLPPPVLTEVSPRTGSQVGGTKVTLLGEDFADGVLVRFGGTAAEATFLTRKQLEAIVPASAIAGDVDVTVENPDGVTSTLEKAFTYEARPAPSITSVSPNMGPSTGGTKVVIEGTNFTKDCQVWVGREYPKDLAVKSATEIHIVTAPRKSPGVVDVEVAAPGLPRATMKNAFRYDAVPAPIITSVAPNAGAVAGGTEMTISGKNFRKDTIVLIDGKPPKTVKFIDAQTLELKTPPGDAGKMVDVAVKNLDGKEAVQKRAFMYDPRYR
ncbi:Light-harvesting LHII, alpha subunit B / Histone protein [Minicystis rosea]|nr:Light-harvesting LHII, alpha subunit B / Histone protein [Minicystis rosea]